MPVLEEHGKVVGSNYLGPRVGLGFFIIGTNNNNSQLHATIKIINYMQNILEA